MTRPASHPRRVVHLAAHYPPYVGGVENAVAALATELRRRGDDVEVLTSSVGAEGRPARATEDGVVVRRYRALRVGNTPVFPGLVVGLLRQPRGTVVHAHGPHAFVSEVASLVCRLRGLPLVLHAHLDVGRSTGWGRLLPAYRALVLGPVLRSADRVLALTPDLATSLRGRHGLRRVVVVPNAPAPAAAPAPLAAVPAADPGAPLRVLYLGRLVAQKRVSRLLDALELCPEPVVATIVGDGDLRADLEAQAARLGLDVHFAGRVDRDGVAGWLGWADLFVLPSEREGMPLAVLEAMAAGVPVLATDVEGTRELVHGHGLLVDTTPAAIADGLTRLARDPDLRADLARRGRERASRDSWASIVDTLQEEYDAVARPPRRPRHRAGTAAPAAVPPVRPLDPTDASWAGIHYSRTLWGLEDVPSLERLRGAYAVIEARTPRLARHVDHEALTWRPLTDAERAARPAQAVLAGGDHATAEEADAAAFALPIDGMQVRVLAGPGYLAARANHVWGDEWTIVTYLNHLLAQARSDVPLELPWTEVASGTRWRLTVRQLASRPRAVLTALRRRSELSGGPFEPARLNADRLPFACTHVASPEGFLAALRAERTARGLDVSLAAVSLVGLRHAVARHLEEPVPGAEVVYDVRREAPVSTRALGNWVAGVYVRPDDDRDVRSVHAAIGEVRTAGLSLVAAAATRRRSRRDGDRGSRLVFGPEGGLRLTLSYIPGHGPLRGTALTRPGAAYFGTNPPNGVNTLTLTCAEVGGRMHLGVEHYPDVWSREQVRQVAATFFADPWATGAEQVEQAGQVEPAREAV